MNIVHGDCLEVMRGMADNSVDSIVTDPPYGLSFMGKKWDYDVPGEDIWRECLRVLKPGGYLLAFAGTRTQHRMAVRIEDAGFEIRDMIAWVYGSGFPKSLDVSKAIDKAAGAERGTKYRAHGDNKVFGEGKGKAAGVDRTPGAVLSDPPVTDAARQWQGWGTALKPALEPITVARKPLIGTVAANVLAHGCGGLNIDGCRVGDEPITQHGRSKDDFGFATAEQAGRAWTGRWPANVCHDGSEEVVGLFPIAGGGHWSYKPAKDGGIYKYGLKDMPDGGSDTETGSAARFFFRAEHDKEDLLFCRAKDILSAWKITRGDRSCSKENASSAESSLRLSKQAAASVLSDAVIAASRGDRLLSDVTGLSTTVTEREFETLCESLITAMLISESVALPAPSQDALIQNGCRVSIAAIQGPTDTTTITISLPTSDGFAEPVTFSIMLASAVRGAKDSSANRLIYCAKASKKDRDEGCEGMDEKKMGFSNGAQLHGEGYDKGQDIGLNRVISRRNHHPTVKPTDLMRYLCRLVTPPGGIVLDPFAGSGSTGKACALEGFRFIGIEREAEYCEIARARIAAVDVGLFGAAL